MICIKQLKLCFIAFFLVLSAFSQKKYDFENSDLWTNNSSQFSISSQNSFAGSQSLKFTIPNNSVVKNGAIDIIDTNHTILKVRTANKDGKQIIIASDYNGTILGINTNGVILWKKETGNGTINHDIWCDDITGDNIDEILVANGNGYIYCFSVTGQKLWEFKPYNSNHLTPMYAVTVVKDASLTPYIVCGNYDATLYYLNSSGTLTKSIKSTEYSKLKPWGSPKPANFVSNANFLKPIPLQDGSDLLFIHTSNNHMQGNGDFYILKPLSNEIVHEILDVATSHPIGEVRVVDANNDGIYEVLYGTSTLNSNSYNVINFTDNSYTSSQVQRNDIQRKNRGVTSYRVNQPFLIKKSTGGYNYAVLGSNQLLLYPETGGDTVDINLSGAYAFNDVYSLDDHRFILASVQDGGSCIYVVDTTKDTWQDDFTNLTPTGGVAKILETTIALRGQLNNYVKPNWQREPIRVTGFEGSSLPIASTLSQNDSLKILASPWNEGNVQDPAWRSPLYDGNQFKDKRDGRPNYTRTEQDVYNHFISDFSTSQGISTWGGHGNDPLFYSLDVLKEIADYGYQNGKKSTIYIYPEMNNHGSEFDFVMDNQIYPLVNHLKDINGKVCFRAKNVFWQGQIYTDTWNEVTSGTHAASIIPALEETTDKTQDLSLLGRMGLWASGAVDGWAVRCSRDDPSFDRSRQFSSQKLSNHVFRKTLFSVACGANYLHNAYADEENPTAFNYHSSLVLELIKKEALFVPKRNEILSFSPVHLSIHNPTHRYLEEGENHKWTTWYDRTFEENNPMVFSHMNATWLGASLTPWDFSSYASGVVDRRQNCIPPYPNGKVLITPVQNGALAKNETRGKLVDHLHPIYKDIMKEYITDGENYIAPNGVTKYDADTYYSVIKQEIESGANKLPITVTGDKVGWVVAQVSPTHLRLSLVDGGYLDPKDREVTVKFNTVSPVQVKDILDHKTFDVINGVAKIDVPCGLFRFIDVELNTPLN